jgi:hypothetical protein
MEAPVLHLGRYETALRAVTQVDAVITDPPYGQATHDANAAGRCTNERRDTKRGRVIGYAHWTPAHVRRFVRFWAPRCRGWFVAMTSHDLCPVYTTALEAADRYVFAPLPFVAIGSRVRLSGDGPSSWTDWIVVSRPSTAEYARWGTLPGAYVLPEGFSEKKEVIGGKPLWLMRALVRDYSRAGELVCDPCAGAATTLVAAGIEGRRAIGAEVDKETHRHALARIGRGYTPDMFETFNARAAQG